MYWTGTAIRLSGASPRHPHCSMAKRYISMRFLHGYRAESELDVAALHATSVSAFVVPR